MIEMEANNQKQQQKNGAASRAKALEVTMVTVTKFEDDLELHIKQSLHKEHAEKLAKLAKTDRNKYLEEKIRLMWETRIDSPLFAPQYFPKEMKGLKGQALIDKYNIKNDSDSGFGIYWPTHEDLVKISKEVKDFQPTDMTLQQIRFKGGCCGYTYFRMVFNKGIMSPEFKITAFDDEE